MKLVDLKVLFIEKNKLLYFIVIKYSLYISKLINYLLIVICIYIIKNFN